MLGLVRHLKTRGHAVSVAAHPHGPLWRAVGAQEIALHALPVRNGFDLRAAGVLRRLVADVDVVHFHTARAHALALWLGGGTACRVVTRRMDYRPRPRAYVRVLYNRRVDKVIAISRGIREVLVAAGVDDHRISVIPSGVDVSRFVGAGEMRTEARLEEWGTEVKQTDPVVLVIGALVRRKGHAVLLEAARRMAQRGRRVRYAFCGDGESRRELERQAERLGLGGFVRFLGWRDDMVRVLAGADVVAVPSLHEGLGVAALEAMAAALPVVASRTGGLGEVVVNESTGWLVPPGDAGRLAEALEAAVRHPEQARRYGAAGQARVSSEFSLERMASENEALYQALVGGLHATTVSR